MRRNARYTPLDVDGPLPVDMFRAVPRIRRDPLDFLQGVVARFGDMVAFPLPRTPVLLVNDPDGVRRVLQENHRGYDKQTVQYTALSMITGEGLLTADGSAWKCRRRIVQPAFHADRLGALVAPTVAAAERLATRWEAADDPAREGLLDVDEALMPVMLEVAGRALFDTDLTDLGSAVPAAVEEALRAVVSQAQMPLPGWWPLPSRARLRRARATLDAVCHSVIAERRAAGVRAGDTDLLALLLRAEELTDEPVRDELLTALIAGHETAASALTWALYLLAGSGQAQARLHAELDAVLDGRLPEWTDLAALGYTRSVVDEALRLYPPAWLITRRAVDADVVAGVRIPAGTLVIISPWLLHHRPVAWPDPQRFDPDRFVRDLAGRAASQRGDYLPFGAGPRLCIGREIALVQCVLVLATLLRKRAVTLPGPPTPGAQVNALVTLRPRGGMRLRLASRS